MVDVKFDEERLDPIIIRSGPQRRGFAGALVSMGLASDESAANIMMVVFGIGFLAFSAFIFKNITANDPAKLIPHPPAPYSQEI